VFVPATQESVPSHPATAPTLAGGDFLLPPSPLADEPGQPWFAFLFGAFNHRWHQWAQLVAHAVERFLPAHCRHDPELTRRAQLIARLGFLVAVFGSMSALFCLLIVHYWG